jgi:acetyltransferase-like isoleucine patch superfamily enzyme
MKSAYWGMIRAIPWTCALYETRDTQAPITVSMWFIQKVLGINGQAYWPMHFTSKVGNVKNIVVGVETCPGYLPGCYVQGIGKVHIGDYTNVAQNVGIISANHDIYDNRAHPDPEGVRIGSYCWIGMNAMILPGVELGDFTIVGAGAVVTKSFPEGYCIVAGNPARMIRAIDKTKCVRYKNKYEYVGYHKKEDALEFLKNRD